MYSCVMCIVLENIKTLTQSKIYLPAQLTPSLPIFIKYDKQIYLLIYILAIFWDYALRSCVY